MSSAQSSATPQFAQLQVTSECASGRVHILLTILSVYVCAASKFWLKYLFVAFSALTLLVGRKAGHVCKKTEWWGSGMVIYLERGVDLHIAQLMLLPLAVSCFSKIQIDFTFLVPAHPGSPGQRAIKRVCVCVCVCVCVRACVRACEYLFLDI